MKTLSATGENVKKLFTSNYVIPDFQRPYSWEEEQSRKLFEDIVDAYKQNCRLDVKEPYFCGSIVLYYDKDQIARVVDGQQRLTTLSLLIRALLEHAGIYNALAECLWEKDPRTGVLDKNKVKINSAVLPGKDRTDYISILTSARVSEKRRNKFEENFEVLNNLVGEFKDPANTAKLYDFIDYLLNYVELLPLKCDNLDDALTIFNTVNSRGLNLSDVDIFKADLYHRSEDADRNTFLNEWNDFGDRHNWLFTILHHITRANMGISDTTLTSLREFYNKQLRRKSPKEILNDIKKIEKLLTPRFSDKSYVLFGIMQKFPNYYWYFSVYIFLFKNVRQNDETGEYELAREKIIQLENLLEDLVKYCYVKQIQTGTASSIKGVLFKNYVEIAKGDSITKLTALLSENDKSIAKLRIIGNEYKKCRDGIIWLAAYLNPNQNVSKLAAAMDRTYDIEHILPQKGSYNTYNGWTEAQCIENLNHLGNLVPLSKSLNITVSNFFFRKKAEGYVKEENIQDVNDLVTLTDWTYEEYKKREEEKQKLLRDFLLI